MIAGDILFCLAVALLLLILPVDWLLSAAAAAVVHEICHILAVIFLGGNIRGIRISLTGCRIDTDPMPPLRSAICISAGPAGSMMLLLVGKYWPQIAVCGFFHGIYNLLPVMPLDGGRLLQLMLSVWCPGRMELIMKWIFGFVCLVGIVLCVVLYCRHNRMILPIIAWLFVNIGILRRKIPCKENRIGLQ